MGKADDASATLESKSKPQMTTQEKINFLMQNHEKDTLSEVSRADADTNQSANSEVISLLEDNDSIFDGPKTPEQF